MKVPTVLQTPPAAQIGLLAVALVCSSVSSSGTALDFVKAYNIRRIGSPGLRRLELQLKSGSQVTRRYAVAHLWRGSAADMRSLVFLEEPTELRGTSYLWIEGASVTGGLQVFLRLPAGQRRVLELVPGRFDQGLLGSDFAYSDLLWQIPTLNRTLRDAGPATLDGAPVRCVDGEPVAAAHAVPTLWPRIRYYMSADGRALHGADYFDRSGADAGARPAKRLRAFGWTDHGGILVPSRMVMTLEGNRSSELTLKSLQLDLPDVDAALFRPEALGRLADEFERGVPRDVFRRGQP